MNVVKISLVSPQQIARKKESYQRQKRVKALKAMGFDESRTENGSVRIRCSQCRAMTVNGVPIHERGCPNEIKE